MIDVVAGLYCVVLGWSRGQGCEEALYRREGFFNSETDLTLTWYRSVRKCKDRLGIDI